MTRYQDKARENRARRAATRQGLELFRCRRRDPRSLGYGLYMLCELADLTAGEATARPVYGDGYTATLAEVESWLSSEEAARRRARVAQPA